MAYTKAQTGSAFTITDTTLAEIRSAIDKERVHPSEVVGFLWDTTNYVLIYVRGM